MGCDGMERDLSCRMVSALITTTLLSEKNIDGCTLEIFRSCEGSLKARSSSMETSGGGKRVACKERGTMSKSRATMLGWIAQVHERP